MEPPVRIRKIEKKDWFTTEQLRPLLATLLHSMEQGTDMNLKIRLREYLIPAEALQNAKVSLKYEVEGTEGELKIKLKWSEAAQTPAEPALSDETE